MQCRQYCGACCIAPSITQPFLGMPTGKAAGERCVHLDQTLRCRIFTHPERPAVCAQFKAEPSFCGDSQAEALQILSLLELQTSSDSQIQKRQ